MTRALRLAAVATIALAVGALLLRMLDPFGAPSPTASDLVPHLWAVGAIVVIALTNSWAPTLAWCAAVIGSAASSLAVSGMVREYREANGADPAPLIGAIVVIAILVPIAIAAAYATSDGRRSRFTVSLAWGSVVVIGTALAVSYVSRVLGGQSGGIPYWLWLSVLATLTAVGLLRDLRPAFARTRVRLAAEAGGERVSSGPLSVLRIFVDELVPGREAGRAEAAEDERGRLAADLHADVLPSLRRALAEAEAGGTVERLAADLRVAVDEVESLLVARRSIVLEELGLLAAVEWLAERVEDRSAVRVEIEVGTPDADGGRPPREVERAAFRVAQLALDNVVRHAPGSHARVSVASSARSVRLRVEDDADTPPIDEAAATRAGRRGIADMRAEAKACGARLDIGRAANGHGTAVMLAWPA